VIVLTYYFVLTNGRYRPVCQVQSLRVERNSKMKSLW
jgi:hypothetical protein